MQRSLFKRVLEHVQTFSLRFQRRRYTHTGKRVKIGARGFPVETFEISQHGVSRCVACLGLV